MIDRRATTAAALAAGAVAVVIMAVWGLNAATAPIDNAGLGSSGPSCAPEDQARKVSVIRKEVTVSVYNTGKRVGRAQATLTLLENAGFRPGAIGNGAKGDTVRRAEVRTTRENDSRAKLVAMAMGKGVPVVVSEESYGPGIDVFIGDEFKKLNPKAPKRLKLPTPEISCDT